MFNLGEICKRSLERTKGLTTEVNGDSIGMVKWEGKDHRDGACFFEGIRIYTTAKNRDTRDISNAI